MVIKSVAALAIVWGGTGGPAPDRVGLDREGVTVAFVMNTLTFTGDDRDLMATPMLMLLAAFAEFERSLLRERQADSIAIATAKGVYKGRAKPGSPTRRRSLARHAESVRLKKCGHGRYSAARRQTRCQ